MMTSTRQLDDLLRLPRSDRARLAKALLESLDEVTEDEDVEGAWVDELERRARDARNDPDALESWSELRERLIARLRAR